MKILVAVFVFALPCILSMWANKPIARYVIKPQVKRSSSNGGIADLPSYNEPLYQSHQRSVRSPSTCRHPDSLEDSQMDCTLYPSKILCNHTCMFGYTFPGGPVRQMKCKHAEDKWTPVPEFERCQPFVDCGLTLGPGGSYTCRHNFMDRGAICDVSCSHYEDKDPVPMATYECAISGKWTPDLPFCAKAGSGMRLISSPKG